jgi:hypothetical protein
MSFTLVFNTTTLGTQVTIGPGFIFSQQTNQTTYICTNPGSFTLIDNSAFFNYRTTIVSVTNIPANVTSIGNYCFSLCTSLINVTFLNNTTNIGLYAFQDCSSLTGIVLPNNTLVTTGCFQRCTSLTTIDIPSSVTTIRASAFQDCSNLGTFTVRTPTALTDIRVDAFKGIKSPSTLYTTAANINNTTLTQYFTYTYLIETPPTTPPTNYYTIQSGQTKDLSQVFTPLTTTSGAATGFLIKNYSNTGLTKDLNQIFEPYTTGTQASATNFIVENYNGSGVKKDLNQIFKPLQ